MLASSSILSRFANRLLSRRTRSNRIRRSDLRRRERAPIFYAAEVMEERALLSATFGSAINIGNDTGSTQALDVATDASANTYVTGYFSGTVDFDQAAPHAGDIDILTSRGPNDAFVAKYAADNSLLWVQRMGGDATSDNRITDAGRKIAVDGSGNVYVTGQFIGSSDFGSTTLTTAGDSDGFVVKLDAAGSFQWAKDWRTTVNDSGYGVGVDSSGNVYALGVREFAGYDIMKFNASGNAVWNQSLVTGSLTITGDLAVDASGNLFAVGTFSGTVDFDAGPKTVSVSDGPGGNSAFTLKLNKDGKFGWVTPFVSQSVNGSAGWSAAQSVTLDGSGNVIVGGYYGNTVDFDPGKAVSTLGATRGGFITKLNSSGGLIWARALESNNSTFVFGLATDSAGDIYASGVFYGTVDFNPGAGVDSRTAAGASDIFVLKLDASGNLVWAETFGGASTTTDIGWGVAVDPAGTTLRLAGGFQDLVDFNPDPLYTNYLDSGLYRDGFLLELSLE